MIAILALLVVIALVVVVPAVTTVVARNVMSSMNRGPSSGSIDQSIVEARLTRIEEAIDAMAQEIERLGDYQRRLLGSPEAPASDEPSRMRTES